MTLPVRTLVLSVAILAPLHAQMPAEKPPEMPPEARLLDTYRLRARQARTARMVALAEALLATKPAEARALLEDPESCSPEDRDGRWLKAWRQTQETALRMGDSSAGVVFSPDGRFLAQPESGHLFRADTGERVEPKISFQALTFAADAKSACYLFSGESLYSLPLETLKPVRAGIDYHFPYAPRRTLLGVGPDSKSIYWGEGGTVYRLALEKGAAPVKAALVGGAQTLTRDGKLLLALRRDGEGLLVNRADAATLKGLPPIPLKGKAPPGGTQARFTPDGMHVLVRAGARLLLHRVQTGGLVREYPCPSDAGEGWAVSEDGSRIAMPATPPGSYGQTLIRILDSAGSEVRAINAGDTPRTLAFSPDGRTLAATFSAGIRLYPLASPTTPVTVTAPIPDKHQARLSPAGNVVAFWTAEQARLWGVEKKADLCTIKPDGAGIAQLWFSLDGRRVGVEQAKGKFTVHEATTGNALCTLAGPESAYQKLAFLPGGRVVALCGDYQLRTFGPDGKEIAKRPPGGTVHLSRDGLTLAVTSGRGGTLIDPLTLKDRGKLDDGPVGVSAIRMAADGGRFVALDAKDKLHVWNAAGKRVAECDMTPGKPMKFSTNRRKYWDLSADGSLVAAVESQGGIRVWETATGRQRGGYSTYAEMNEQYVESKFGFSLRATGTGYDIFSLGFSEDGKVLRCAAGKFFSKEGRRDDRWNVAEDGWANNVSIPDNARWVVSSWDGGAVAVATDKEVTVRAFPKGPLAGALVGHHEAVTAVSYSADGSKVYTSSKDGGIREWDAASSRLLRAFADQAAGVEALAPAPDGKSLYLLEGGRIGQIDIEAGKARAVGKHTPAPGVQRLAVSPDGKLLAVNGKIHKADTGEAFGKAGIVRAFRPGTADLFDEALFTLSEGGERENVRALKARSLITTEAAFSPSGGLLAITRPDSAIVFDVAKDAKVWERPGGGIAAWSPDGKHLALADKSVVRVLDAATGKVLLTRSWEAGAASCLTFSPDGGTLAVGDRAGIVRLWRMP